MAHIHLIGIGGSGLSAIARVLLERGETVSGSDRQQSPLAARLQEVGATVYYGHQAGQVRGADLVVRSSAIPEDNVEVQAALRAGIPVYKRAEFLEQLLQNEYTLAVAGTHGKTTTTAMIAWALTALGKDPSYIIGGVADNLGANAHAGKGSSFVIEADEYDRMFLGLSPSLAVITNIEHDHPDCYPTAEAFLAAFHEFAARIRMGGTLLACGDDEGVRALLAEAHLAGRQILLYGLRDDSQEQPYTYYARLLGRNHLGGFDFEAYHQADLLGKVSLLVPGVHNVLNALAALAVAHVLELPGDQVSQALGEFRGTGRRFDVRGEVQGITVVDDYAHHPTEIKSTLAAARVRYPGRKIWVVWQPHTYSRTRMFFDAYLTSFQDADQLLVTEIYPAREAPPADGFSAVEVVKALAHPQVRYAPTLDMATQQLVENLQPGDVLLVLSAGDGDQISHQVLTSLNARRAAASG